MCAARRHLPAEQSTARPSTHTSLPQLTSSLARRTPHGRLALAQKRGLGAHPCKLYGVFQPPTLSAPQLRLTGLALIACLLGACTPLFPRVFCFAAFLLSLCYFPQLFAEVTCSGHSTILIPSILFLLSCAPSLDHQVRSTSEWPLHLIRIYISVGYFSSGMCKLLCGARFNRFWGKGPTLQAYIFDGMWSRPAGPVVTWLQRLLLTSPWIATLLASGSVVFETGFILAPTSDLACLFLGLNGLAFHLGIYLLQGLDFATFWMPALFVFLVGIPTGEPWQALRARVRARPRLRARAKGEGEGVGVGEGEAWGLSSSASPAWA